MASSFREQAKAALERANGEIESKIDVRLRYAALELRICIEAVTYDRAQCYEELLAPDVYSKWQPQRLMESLIEIEPHANEGPTVHFLDESNAEARLPTWVSLGKETVFTLKDIRDEYHALGSFVHLPNLDKAATGTNFEKMRTRCIHISSKLTEVLSSPVFNAVFQNIVELPCDSCGNTILKHVPAHAASVEAKCYKCNAAYKISAQEDGTYSSHRLGKIVPCINEGCDGVLAIPREEIKDRAEIACQTCKSKFFLAHTYRLTRA